MHIASFTSNYLSVGILSASVLFFSCGTETESAKQQTKNSGIQTSLPHFVLQTLDYQIISAEQFAGKVLVVDFWATWCRPCLTEIPNYNELNAKYQGTEFSFVGITMDSGDAATLKAFASKFNIKYPIYIGDHDVANAFGGIQGFPTTLVIDKTGTVRQSYLGIAKDKAEEIDALVKILLEEDRASQSAFVPD